VKFSEYPYERPDVKKIKQLFKELLSAFDSAETYQKQEQVIADINKLRSEMETQIRLVTIRHSIDTQDEFYRVEKEYIDEIAPVLEEYTIDFYRALVNSKFQEELERQWGSQLFRLAEQSLKAFTPEMIEDLQKENKLSTEYGQLIASAKIPFDQKELTLSELKPFELSTDRNVRQRAAEARFQFMADHEAQLDRIYDDLVKVRTKMAQKVGFPHFTELGYTRMKRTDYDAEMVARFREQVLKHIVPLATKLRERQRRRIGVHQLYYYDEGFSFQSGNATPKGDAEWIIQKGVQMYTELSPEVNTFFSFMINHELMDLLSKKGKEYGGYCTYLSEYGAPFIFANFNGTADDIDVLTHEAGHAFQVYESRDHQVPEYFFPTTEAAEIHSMSMEFFTYPWMNLFFEEDTDKYKFNHVTDLLLFIPYGVAVDEFQHFVYGKPEATPAERKQAWRDIERK
jgi:M3 family oligoendopeptidase